MWSLLIWHLKLFSCLNHFKQRWHCFISFSQCTSLTCLAALVLYENSFWHTRHLQVFSWLFMPRYSSITSAEKFKTILVNNICVKRKICHNTGIKRDKTTADKLMYNGDTQNYPFCRLQLVVETFDHSTKWTNQSKFNKNPHGC